MSPLVLLVDDEPIVRRATARAIRAAGFEVVEASSFEGAVIEMSRREPWAVITDYDLGPGMRNGGAVCQWAWGLAGIKRRVVFTGSAAEANIDPGVAGSLVLEKPRLDYLIWRLREWLEAAS